jgi:hypothetical protein
MALQLTQDQFAVLESITPLLGAALQWAHLGVPVLPCDPETKSPLVKGGKLAATTDPGRIIQWWRKFPAAMIGGRADGLVILDWDAYKPNADHDWIHYALSDFPTRTYSTPGHNGVRGRHLVYRDPDGLCRSTVLGRFRTIDVRSGTSADYIVLPPSVNGHGKPYEVSDWRPPTLVPDWLAEAAGRSRKAASRAPDPDTPAPALALVVPIRPVGVADPSEHTYLLIRNGVRQGLTRDQIREQAEADDITTARREEQRRQQPGWWDDEFTRCYDQATREVWDGEGDDKPTTAQVVLQIARREFDIGQTWEHVPFAVPRTGPRLARIFRGSRDSLRSALAMRFEQEYGRPPSQNAMSEAMQVLLGIAETKPLQVLPMRVARHEDTLVLDLGRQDGHVVVIGPDGWEVVRHSPVLFLRTDLTGELPLPQRGESIEDTLYPMINVGEDDRPLVLAALLSWLWPDIPHPVIYLKGEEGTAKSTAARILRSLVDPSPVEVRRQPGKDEDWEVTIAGQWAVVLDNLSTMADWLSDAICTAVTGTGDIKRKKYSDQELSVIWLRRCFLLTSIDALVSRGDLVDRSILFELEPISVIRDDHDIWDTWSKLKPLALGALLDLASRVLATAPHVTPPGRFRMADFARIATALDQVSGTDAMARYRTKIADGIQATVDQDPFAAQIIALARRDGGWEGSAQLLFDNFVKPRIGRIGTSDAWPKSHVQVGIRLTRLQGIMRKSGVRVTKGTRTRHGVVWQLRTVD